MGYLGHLASVTGIESFVKAHRMPFVSKFDADIAADLFSDGRPVLFLFRDQDEQGKQAELEIQQVAPTFKREILCSMAGSSEPMDQRLMDYLSVDAEEFPTARYVVNPADKMVKYRLTGKVTADSVTTFVRGVQSGEFRPHLKSEEAPMEQSEAVYNLVGSTFDTVVMDTSKDVLVKFYAPWCGHCKKLEPVSRDLGKKFAGVGSLIVAKIDATANDVEGIDVEGFPTIKFWPAKNKDQPIDYDSDRDVESFSAWLSEKASIPFSREELRSEL